MSTEGNEIMTSLAQVSFIDLCLDQLPVNSVVCRLWDDADSLFSSFLCLKSISPIYTEKEREKAIQRIIEREERYREKDEMKAIQYQKKKGTKLEN